MCGLAGIYSFDQKPLSPKYIQNMIEAIKHRGPDHEALWSNEYVHLASARLRIIDLSKEASQPICNEDGTLWLVYNGEIYNFNELRAWLLKKGHTFRSKGDSEVIVHLYEEEGPECVHKLDGMFALAIWDQRKKEFFLARDRSGKKPLFYYLDEHIFVFSSEIKSFFQLPQVNVSIDQDKFYSFFLRGYLSSPETLYKNVQSLEAGTQFMVTSEKKVKYQKYWDWILPQEKKKITFQEASQSLSGLLYDAVKKRLISDVPLGAFLSGGIDSTIIVGMMKEILNKQIKTFSIGFEGDPHFDETQYAAMAASHFETEHYSFKIKSADLPIYFDRLLWQYDGPFGDSSALPSMMVSELASKQVTVVLNGDGGDELFIGYERMCAAHYLSHIPSFMFKAGQMALNHIPRSSSHYSPLGKIFHLFRASGKNPLQSLDEWLYIFNEEELKNLFKEDILNSSREPHADYKKAQSFLSSLDQVQYLNFKQYLQNDLNVKMDRASMAYGLETRSPFLDQKLTEYAASLPNTMKLKRFKTKYILKEAFKNYLPPAIQKRGKHGFGVPIAAWFRNDLKDFVGDTLLTSSPRYAAFLNKDTVYKIVDEHFSRRKEKSSQIWLLLSFERWLQKLPSWRTHGQDSSY